MDFHGIIPPVATPMKADEDLDLPRFRWFLDHLIGKGMHGLFVLGTNSEFCSLDEREKQEVIATAVSHVDGRVPLLAGTGWPGAGVSPFPCRHRDRHRRRGRA
jgi:4-hydroxy-tetrahydrodipicolinate synthase